jgi:hypothetical protein
MDGRTDLLFQGPGGVQEIINTEVDELEAGVSMPLPIDIDFTHPAVSLRDFNGDGHLDFVRKEIDRTRGRVRVWFGKGAGAGRLCGNGRRGHK